MIRIFIRFIISILVILILVSLFNDIKIGRELDNQLKIEKISCSNIHNDLSIKNSTRKNFSLKILVAAVLLSLGGYVLNYPGNIYKISKRPREFFKLNITSIEYAFFGNAILVYIARIDLHWLSRIILSLFALFMIYASITTLEIPKKRDSYWIFVFWLIICLFIPVIFYVGLI